MLVLFAFNISCVGELSLRNIVNLHRTIFYRNMRFTESARCITLYQEWAIFFAYWATLSAKNSIS